MTAVLDEAPRHERALKEAVKVGTVQGEATCACAGCSIVAVGYDWS